MDWSDHAMWWPEKNIWLDNTRWTLDQYNITADAFIHFTPMHKTLRIQLPDLRYVDCSVDFSLRTFSAVLNLCSELEIRHPEELSLCKPLDIEHLKFNYSQYKRAEEKRRRVTLGAMPNTTRRSHSPNMSISQVRRFDLRPNIVFFHRG
jgi:kindlin 2